VYTTKKILILINSFLRMVLRICWPDNISSEELWQRTNQSLWIWRSGNGAWGVKATLYVNQQPTPQDKPSDGTLRERDRGAGHEKPGVEISRKMQRQTTHGHSWRNSHRI
jgi:hypothetical protein